MDIHVLWLLGLQCSFYFAWVDNNRRWSAGTTGGTRRSNTQVATAIAAAFVVATTISIGVAFASAFAGIGRQLWAETWLVDVTADRHELIVAISRIGHIDGTLLSVRAWIALARVQADALFTLRLRFSWHATHAVGTAQIPAFIIIRFATVG